MLWIILGIILLILIILLFSPVKVYVKYFDGKPEVVIKYLFFSKLPDLNQKEDKPEKEKNKKKKTDKKKSSKEKKKFIPDTVSGKLHFFKNLADSGGHALRIITKHIKIKDIFIDLQISDLDACDCAMKFGKANIIVYNLLSYLGCFLKLKKKSINIRCVYNQPECFYNVSFNVRVSPAAAILTVSAFIFRFFVNNSKNSKSDNLNK